MSGILLVSVGNSYGYEPINLTLPEITGTAQVGQTLSCSTGTWDAAPSIDSYAYQWIRGASTEIAGATSSSYTATVTDAGETLKCRVTATNAVGDGIATSLATSAVQVEPDQQEYTTAGTYSWVAPTGVTSVSVVAVGSGAAYSGPSSLYSGSGGGLGYKNNYTVTPGSSYSVIVGAAVQSGDGNDSVFNNTSTCVGYGGTSGSAAAGGSYVGDGGGNGGDSGSSSTYGRGGGGGAGGYSGNGGNGGNGVGGTGASGSGGGGGGGGAGDAYACRGLGGGGGGVGIYGEGSSGSGGGPETACSNGGRGGGGGSGGADGVEGYYATYGVNAGAGGDFGGGQAYVQPLTSYSGGGAVRIIWPGTSRSFPSTNTGDL